MNWNRPIRFCGIIASLLLLSCEETIEVPVEPSISFKSFSVEAYDEQPAFFQLQFDLKDGDGDIGLLPDQNFVPFHEFDLILDVDDQLVKKSNEVSPPFYRLQPNGEKFFFSELDDRPEFNDFNYMLMDSAVTNEALSDTVLIHRNLFHDNLFISVLKRSGDVFVPWINRSLNTDRPPISGRFNVSEATGKEEPVISEVLYQLSIEEFAAFNLQDTLKLEFYIFDRKLHQSNIEVSPEFRLSDLLKVDQED